MIAFDLTIFENDDLTPFFGSAEVDEFTGESGALEEADFSTDPTHPRPYLREVKDWSATEVEFNTMSSTIGELRLEVLDKRTDPADQDSGILTARLEGIIGKRALLRRFDPTTEEMVPCFNGVIKSYTMGGSGEGLVVVTLSIRDMRERERDQRLFVSNTVLFGKDGGSGPAINYGELPVSMMRKLFRQVTGVGTASYLIKAVEPYQTAAPHFIKRSEAVPADGIHWGYVLYHDRKASNAFNIVDMEEMNSPTQGADGLWYYNKVGIRWRYNDGDAWTYLDVLGEPAVRAQNAPLAMDGKVNFTDIVTGKADPYAIVPRLYIGSTDPGRIPTPGVPLQIQLLAQDITENSPFFWDGGTLGTLLREIYDGLHSPGAPAIPYNEEAMAAFEANTPRARLVLGEQPENMREWVEKNIYAAAGYAPALDADGKVHPVSVWAFPTDLESVPVLDVETLIPIGKWEHGSSNVINQVEYKYLREGIADQEVTVQKINRRFWPDKHVRVTGTLSEWERYFVREVISDHRHVDSIETFGAKKLTIAPWTIRSFGDATGRPRSAETADEAGSQLASQIATHVLDRFKNGAPIYSGTARSTMPGVSELVVGQWVRAAPTWFPDYSTGKRGARRFMQIRSISDEDPTVRQFTLVDGGLPDYTSDPDVIDEENGECLDATDDILGGIAIPLPTGHQGWMFSADGSITNGCAEDLTLPAILLIAGGGAGGAGPAGGGGGAGGVGDGFVNPLFRDVLIKAGVTAQITVGAGGSGVNVNGDDTVLWLRRISTGTPGEEAGTALDPMTDDPNLGYRAVGGGHGGGNDGVGGGGGSGGGAGGWLPISGGDSNNGGGAEAGQGSPGGGGAGGGGIATCQHAYGGGGGSYGGAGRTGRNNEGCGEPGEGGPMTTLRYWGVKAGGGGKAAAQSVPQALGDLCCNNSIPGATGATGYGYGGGGSTGVGGAPGGPGVAIIAFRGAGIPMLFAPVISSQGMTPAGTYEVCITEEDWPLIEPPNYKVRLEYAVTQNIPPLFGDNLVRDKPWASAGYTPSDVSPLSGAPETGYDFPQPQTVHREFGAKWEEMYGTRWDINGAPTGGSVRTAPGGQIPRAGANRDDYVAAGGVVPGGLPAGFYGALIRPVVSLPAEGYTFEVGLGWNVGSGEASWQEYVLFNFDPATGNGYGVDIGGGGGARGMVRLAGWVPTAVGLNFGAEPGDVGGMDGSAKLRITTRPDQQLFSRGGSTAERNHTEFDPSNGGIYIWIADGRWNQTTFPQAVATYAFNSITVYEEDAEENGGMEPAADSGDWLLGGILEDPGCIQTPPVPAGAKVWTRVIAEGDNYPPSTATEGSEDPGTGEIGHTAPETPVLVEYGVTVDPETGIATVTWDPDLYTGYVRIRGQIHTEAEATSLPEELPFIADRPAEEGSYVLPGTLSVDEIYTVDLESWGGVADPPGNVPLVKDDFNRANGGLNVNIPAGAGTWVHTDATSPAIVSNRMSLSEFGTHYVWNSAVNREEMFVQAGVVGHGNERETGIIARFNRNGPTDRDGYCFIADVDTPGYRLEKVDGDVFTTLDSVAEPLVDTGTSVMQLYVKDSLQEAWADLGGGHSLEAADATFDAVAGSAGVRYGADASEGTRHYDDFLVMPSKYAIVRNLPSGWKAKILDDADAVVVEATEVAGVATMDCSRHGGCPQNVPFNGWAKLIVTDAADVEQAVLLEVGDPLRVYPGIDVEYSADTGITGGLEDEGNTYRTIAENEPPDVLDLDDVADEIAAVMDNLVFDDDLNLMLDDDKKLLTAEE